MYDERLILLSLWLFGCCGFGAACSTSGEVQPGEVFDPPEVGAAETDGQRGEVDSDQWRAIVHPSDPMLRHFPRLVPPAGASHDALPCRIESSEGTVIHLEYDEEGRRSRVTSELPSSIPAELPIHDQVHTYSHDDDGELVRLVIAPVEEDESKDILDITIETEERDEFGNPLRQVYGGWADYEIHSTYDDQQRLLRAEALRSDDGELMSRKEISYDEFGRPVRLEEDYDLDGEANEVTTYVYGEDGRLREQVRESSVDERLLDRLGADQNRSVLTYVYECGD